MIETHDNQGEGEEKVLVPHLVTIIVPVYNVEKYINSCIESLASQSYEQIEIILVDDGSPDTCPTICDAWASHDNRIRVIHELNAGLSVARNAGLAIASGEYILFVDSDDYIKQSLVDDVVSRMDAEHSEVCLFSYIRVTEDGRQRASLISDEVFPATTLVSGEKALIELFDGAIQNYAPMRMVRHDYYRKINFKFPEGKNLEDMATTYYVLGEAQLVSIINDALYYYRQRSGTASITSYWNPNLTDAACDALAEMESYVSQRYNDILYLMLNYELKFLLWCFTQEESVSKKTLHSESIKKSILNLARKMTIRNINLKNILKIVLLKCGLLTKTKYLYSILERN